MLKSSTNTTPSETSEKRIIIAVYLLYVMISITGVFGPIIGFILALKNKNKVTTTYGKSHNTKQIRLAIYCLSGIIIGLLLAALAFTVMYQMDLDRSYDFLTLPGIVLVVLSILWFLISGVMGLWRAYSGNSA